MRWTLKPKPDLDKVTHLQDALQVDETVATLLVQRGIETFDAAKAFFRPSLKHLHDPYLMKDMDKAVARIEKAIANKENILVYGDYDVDGTTAVALMSTYLKTKHGLVYTYIPNRYDEGYGVSLLASVYPPPPRILYQRRRRPLESSSVKPSSKRISLYGRRWLIAQPYRLLASRYIR